MAGSSRRFRFLNLRRFESVCALAAVAALGCTDPLQVGPSLAASSPGAGGIGGNGGTGGARMGAGGASNPSGAGGTGGSSTVDHNWAEWPMPNSLADVAAGAPNPESYTDNGDGTVTDDVTGLVWQQTMPSTGFTWAEAVSYCSTLNLAGHSDWRLPSRIELVSIVDASVSEPSINSTAFPGTPWAYTWSSTPMTRWSSSAWSVNFRLGYADTDNSYYGNSGIPEAAANAVRCVRSAGTKSSVGRYTISADTVYDANTKLTWQQTVPTTKYLWSDAKTYCASAAVTSALGGSGWRLPTYKELLTIVDSSQSSDPMIDRNAFPGTPSSDFWSSTPEADSTSVVWCVDFSYGITDLNGAPPGSSVRCVR